MSKKNRRTHRQLRLGMVTDTGIAYTGRHRELPKPAGRHVWVMAAAFRVIPRPDAEYHLDMENLLTVEGPGCLHCERPYSPQLDTQPCLGEWR